MKFKCPQCGRIYYSDSIIKDCKSCGGSVDKVSKSAESVSCEISGENTNLIGGIPSCNYFRLINAPGQRCTFEGSPSKCSQSKLPEYNPRVGTS